MVYRQGIFFFLFEIVSILFAGQKFKTTGAGTSGVFAFYKMHFWFFTLEITFKRKNVCVSHSVMSNSL